MRRLYRKILMREKPLPSTFKRPIASVEEEIRMLQFKLTRIRECPVLWTGMNASGVVQGGDAIPSLAQRRYAVLLNKSERVV